ncbi:MAG: NAD(P)/FAD-dependent oxidoreductase [Candidatus Aenigmarchaeota archaeon]|nr:NAD(P)/FAD-dependent oxidoreductase [Candidatus Aenigmarchaeota archaeon]
MYDVIIVGGGPIGLYLAHLLEARLDVLVLDKNAAFGRKADSGLYSTNLEQFIPIDRSWVEHEVRAAVLHAPSGEVIALKKPRTAAYVADRERFTAWLAKRVQSPVKQRARVTGLSFGKTVTVTTTAGTFEGKVVIGCDGASSIVRKHLGVQPAEILNGLIAITQEKNLDPQVDLYFDKDRIRDGFFWKIPRGHTTEYGALGKNVHYRDLEAFFTIKDYERRAAFMNLGLFPTAFDRAILVGEAAGQVKPWSLGGIIFGFTCATLARDVLFEAFTKQDFSAAFLQRYDQRWKKKIGTTIRAGMLFRGMYVKMDNATLDSWFRRIKRIPFLGRLDMDFPALDVFG